MLYILSHQPHNYTGLNNLLVAYEDKSAYALCTIAYHSGEGDSEVVLFEGKTMVKYNFSDLDSNSNVSFC